MALKSFAPRVAHLDRFYQRFALQRGHLTRCYAHVSLAISLVVLLIIPPSAYSERWHENGASSELANQGGVGDFGAMVIMTTNAEQALKNWEAPPSQGFHVSTDSTVTRNRPIEALVVFSGCEPDEEGNCDTSVDYLIEAPDGSTYGEFLNTELWRGKPAIPVGKLGLAVDRVVVRIEDGELLGKYIVECTVRDHVAGTSFDIVADFTVEEDESE